MTEITMILPDMPEAMLHDRLRAERIAKMRDARTKLTNAPLTPMTPEEVNAEIEAYCKEQRRALGS